MKPFQLSQHIYRWQINVMDYGAKGDDVTDDTAAIQAAINAAQVISGTMTGGTVFFPAGRYRISAALAITGNNVALQGENKDSVLLIQQAPAATVLNITGSYGRVSSMGFTNLAPAAGAMGIYGNAAHAWVFDNLGLAALDRGIDLNACGDIRLNTVSINNYLSIGLYLHDGTYDVFVDNFIFDATVASKGTLGGIRMFNQVAGVNFTNGHVLHGTFGLTTDAAVNGPNQRPASAVFTNVMFDNAKTNGIYLNNCVNFDFNSCAISSAGYNDGGAPVAGSVGVSLANCDDVRFIGGSVVGCQSYGVLANTGSRRFKFIGMAVRENSRSTANLASGISIIGGVSDFQVIGCSLTSTDTLYITSTQKYGIEVRGGASDRYVIANNLVAGNGTGGVSDNGTGVNKTVAGNW